MSTIAEKINEFKQVGDMNQYKKLIAIADEFMAGLPDDIINDDDLDTGLSIWGEMNRITHDIALTK